MPATAETAKSGDIFHVEIKSTDPERTRAFMSDVFGWSFDSTPHPDFHLLETPGGGEGHIGPAGEEGGSVTSYVLVADLNATAERIETVGGRIVAPAAEAPGQGRYLWFEAPGGERMVAWENASA